MSDELESFTRYGRPCLGPGSWAYRSTLRPCAPRSRIDAEPRRLPAASAFGSGLLGRPSRDRPSDFPPYTQLPVNLTSIEICAGAGGSALGLERAGFTHVALVENDPCCVETLRSVRRWRKHVLGLSIKDFYAKEFDGEVDLFSGGVPCPPFSRAGKQLCREGQLSRFWRC